MDLFKFAMFINLCLTDDHEKGFVGPSADLTELAKSQKYLLSQCEFAQQNLLLSCLADGNHVG
jgi:hypothetical protein